MSEKNEENSQSIFGRSHDFFDSGLDLEALQTNREDQRHEGLSNLSDLFYPNSNLEHDITQFQCKPDEDSIKMFVGQIPQSVDENELLPIFEQFGKVYELRVLRDKTTKRSKGCCFLTYFTRKAALNAQNALHNIKVLPGMHHPMQIKPADCENRTDRKLFVGMLPKKFSESDVRNLFSPYGTIEECTVLRDSNKQSKSCAFITYLSRQSAHNAVKSMHHCHVFEGCSSPMVVKFADTQKDKNIRRLQLISEDEQSQLAHIFQKLSTDSLSSLVASNNILHQLQNYGYINMNPQMSVLNHLSLPAAHQVPMWNQMTASPSSSLQNVVNSTLLSQMGSQNVGNMTVNDVMTLNNLLLQLNGNGNVGLTTIPQGNPESVYSNILPSPDRMTMTRGYSWDKLTVSPKQIEGPDGANLFIYHLPIEFTDQKLAELFKPYGRVVSAKVFIDKVTRLSKCFGFVSYDNVVSAKIAIRNLNEYSIHGKKLKVETKKKKR